MKVLIITTSFEENPLMNKDNPNDCYPEPKNIEDAKRTIEDNCYPIGLGYLYSYIKEKGYDVRLLNLNYYPEEDCSKEVLKSIQEEKPDVISFQMLSPNRTSTCAMIEKVHLIYPNLKIVVGGIHITIMYNQIIKRYPYLFLIAGEGEETFVELLKEFSNKKPNYKKIKGLIFSKYEKIIVNQKRPLIENLDALPFPPHEIFINKNVIRAGILTSRGCHFKCSFCGLNPDTHGSVRFRSIDNVFKELVYILKIFPWIKEIWIYDDNFFLDNKRVIDLCKRIITLKTRVEFVCWGRIKPISLEMISYLEKANFKRVLLGVESGSPEVLAKTGKGITVEEVLECFKKFKHSKMDVKPFHIIGLPGENEKTVIESAKFYRELQKIKYEYAGSSANYLRVYPGTKVFEIAKEKGALTDEYWNTTNPCPLYTYENTPKQLYEYGEIYLNHVSLDRFFTWQGFSKQWVLIPHIIAYMVQRAPKKLEKLFLKGLYQKRAHERRILE